jgi:hypothetical protein
MRRFVQAVVIACLAGLMLAGPAAAAKRIYSYDSANPLTEQMTEAGLTFIFDRTFMSTRVERILETHDIGAADVKPASEGELGPGGLTALIGPNAHERALYEIQPKGDGRALIRALCPGADRVFLAFGPITAEQPLRIHALGHDAKTGASRLCITLDYAFHGEWAVGPPDLPQPDRSDRFNDAPTNRRY